MVRDESYWNEILHRLIDNNNRSHLSVELFIESEV